MKTKYKEKYPEWNTSKRNVKAWEIKGHEDKMLCPNKSKIVKVAIFEEFMEDMKPQLLGNTLNPKKKNKNKSWGRESVRNVQNTNGQKQSERKDKLSTKVWQNWQKTLHSHTHIFTGAKIETKKQQNNISKH